MYYNVLVVQELKGGNPQKVWAHFSHVDDQIEPKFQIRYINKARQLINRSFNSEEKNAFQKLQKGKHYPNQEVNRGNISYLKN